MNLNLKSTTAALLVLAGPAFADMDAAKAFLDAEIGDLSSISNPETIQPIADLQKEKS